MRITVFTLCRWVNQFTVQISIFRNALFVVSIWSPDLVDVWTVTHVPVYTCLSKCNIKFLIHSSKGLLWTFRKIVSVISTVPYFTVTNGSRAVWLGVFGRLCNRGFRDGLIYVKKWVFTFSQSSPDLVNRFDSWHAAARTWGHRRTTGPWPATSVRTDG